MANAMFRKVFKLFEENFNWKNESLPDQFKVMYPFIIKQRVKFTLNLSVRMINDGYIRDAKRLIHEWLRLRKNVRQLFLTV